MPQHARARMLLVAVLMVRVRGVCVCVCGGVWGGGCGWGTIKLNSTQANIRTKVREECLDGVAGFRARLDEKGVLLSRENIDNHNEKIT